jgi:hypothetical protein
MRIEELRPPDLPDSMVDAWLGCISWAVGNAEVVEAFRADTGVQWRPGRTGLERMIDEATGADRKFIEAFIVWVNENLWGSLDD